MAKFVLDYLSISNGADLNGDVGTISNVIVETSLPTIEPNQVTVDDGQVINESYTINVEMRTKESNFDANPNQAGQNGTANGTAILGGVGSPVSVNGSIPAKSYIKMVGKTNSFNIDLAGGIYLNGYEDYSNGRIETVLFGTLEVISATDGLTTS
jgi:hypothetical protein